MSQSAYPVSLPGENWVCLTKLPDLEATAAYAAWLAQVVQAGDLLVLTGGLGAGKTTFTRSLARALGVDGEVSSPTFVLARHHEHPGLGPDLVHVDAYRTDAAGMESLDLVATAATAVTVVEWGRGVVETKVDSARGSWLDLELVVAGTDGDERAVGHGGVDHSAMRTDFSELEDEAVGTSREAVLRGYGPRWRDSPA